MRKFFSIIAISALLVVAVMTTSAKAAELEELEIGRCVIRAPSGYTNVGLRAEPSVNSVSLVLIPDGTEVSCYERVESLDGGVWWYRVSYNGYTGYIYRNWAEAFFHVFQEYITMTTSCTEETYRVKYCACGYEAIVEIIPAIGHDLRTVYVGDQGKPYSCENGGTKVSYCVRPGCHHEESEVIPPGHIYKEVSVIKPTYHSTGTQTMECVACGYRDYITIPVLVDDGMSSDVFAMGQAFLSGAWKLFGVYVPGFGFTFGGMLIGVALVSLSLSVIFMIFGFGGRHGGSVSARSGSTSKAKISKERENDER